MCNNTCDKKKPFKERQFFIGTDGKPVCVQDVIDRHAEQDEVLYCTGSVTEYQIKELKRRIANGTTTADDVVLLERILYGRVSNGTVPVGN